MIKKTEGGVCAAAGFSAFGMRCGIRKNKTKKDLAIILSDRDAAAAAVYTTNLVKGAPLTVTKRHLDGNGGTARAAICNSGIANTCCEGGVLAADTECRALAGALGIPEDRVIVASTGVIGQPLDPGVIVRAIPELVSGLSPDGGPLAAEAIMTTDTRRKETAYEFSVGDTVCRIGGCAKGSGMIHPNMATMLVFITTDAAVSPAMLERALSDDIDGSFNMISIDGDTSTNDMVSVMANGAAGNALIDAEGPGFDAFREALSRVTDDLCRMIAADGEGASRLLVCEVSGAATLKDARLAARSVISSNLLKAAMFGADANWGRVLCAAGYSGASFDPSECSVFFSGEAGRIEVCRGGCGVDFSEEEAKKILSGSEITIEVGLGNGKYSARALGCDLTYDYVKINGDYRT